MAAGIAAGPVHSFGVKRHDNATGPVDGDEPSCSSKAGDLVEDLLAGVLQRHLAVFNEAGDIIGSYRADEGFPVACAGDGTGGIVGIDAASDDAAVTQPPVGFVH